VVKQLTKPKPKMSKLTITATSAKHPSGKTLWTEADTPKVIFVESDKIVILPREGADKAAILANGFEFWVDAEPAELAAALSSVDVSAYT